MKKHLSGIFLCIIALLAYTAALAQVVGVDADSVLTTAESVFKDMKAKKYGTLWSRLTTKSQETILKDIMGSAKDATNTFSKEQIQSDMRAGGMIAASYWNGVLTAFNPDIILNESTWGIGFVKPDRAEIVIRYKKSDQPVRLQMSKEDGLWKVGLTETFWARK